VSPSGEPPSEPLGSPQEGVLLAAADVTARLAGFPAWRCTHGGTHLRRDWTLPDFHAAVTFAHDVARLAERERHQPDLRVEGYTRLSIELTTHAVDGLSIKDFSLAAEIDRLAPDSVA
jgi:4a-hydroxytetrahydrobiopterin dehydratase